MIPLLAAYVVAFLIPARAARRAYALWVLEQCMTREGRA